MSKYRIPANHTIFDAAITLYGGVEYALKLMLQNPFIVDLNSDVSGIEVVFDATFKPEVLIPLLSAPKVNSNMVQTWKPYDGQTIFDIALQLDGGFENIISLIKNSTLDNINSEIDQTKRFIYNKKSSTLLDWAEKTGYIFKSKMQHSEVTPDTHSEVYINALIASGYTVSDPEKQYIRTFFDSLITAGLLSKLIAIYPMMGGSSASHSINAINPGTYDITFSGMWVHSLTGAKPDGITADGDTNLNPVGILGFDSVHLAFYSGTAADMSNGADIGHASGGIYNHIYADYFGTSYLQMPLPNMITGTPAGTDGWFIGSRDSFTNSVFKRNTTSFGTNTTDVSAYAMVNTNIHLANTSGVDYSAREHRFASIGYGLTSAECDIYYSIVQTLQTNLGRQV